MATVRARGRRPAPTDPSRKRADTPGSRGQIGIAPWSGAEQMAGWGPPFLLTFLPSLALYGFLTWSVVHFFKRREALYVLVALAPFAWWAFAVIAGSYTKAQAEKEHAAVAIVPPPAELPDTIVFEGKAAFPKPADIRKYFGFRYAIYVRDRAKSAGSRLASRSSSTICAIRRAIKPDDRAGPARALRRVSRERRQRLLERRPGQGGRRRSVRDALRRRRARRPDRPLLPPLRPGADVSPGAFAGRLDVGWQQRHR